MDIEKRTWMIRSNKGETWGPFPEHEFQEKLRAGEFPYYYSLKSNQMKNWQPLLEVVSTDETFRRASTIPPSSDSE
ncbi:MAG: hypothetical protein JXR76_05995 [Deltaproteobacteria bacterium]|nr:hypothetical protein [Deltaproteobacteria bacterium]